MLYDVELPGYISEIQYIQNPELFITLLLLLLLSQICKI